MAAPADVREIAEKLVLAGVGAVALTAERADALAEELAARGGIGSRGGAGADRGAGRPLAQRERPARRVDRVGNGGPLPRARPRHARRGRGARASRRPARAPAAAARAVNPLRRLGSVEAGWWVGRKIAPRVAVTLAPAAGYGVERVPLEGGGVVAANHFSGDRPSADRLVLAPAALLPGEGRAVRDPGARTGPELARRLRRSPRRGRPRGGAARPGARARGEPGVRARRGHAAALRASGAAASRRADDRDAGGRAA